MESDISAASNLPAATIRLGARGSLLSRMQSGMVAETLRQKYPGMKVELVLITTSGDKIQDRPLHEFGGKGLFTKELEQALLRSEVDFAVHSFKDVPVTMPLVATEDLVIAATPRREDPRDMLASRLGKTIAALPAGARVGTGSLRRQAQVLAARPDLVVVPIRGNVDTRIRKLTSGEYDAVILACAGCKRAGLVDESYMTPLATDVLLPAAGQGALALQCRRSDTGLIRLLSGLDDPTTAMCVKAERAVVQRLNGDCHSPIAAYATVEGSTLHLRAAVARRDGQPPVIRSESEAGICDADRAVAAVVAALEAQGAVKLLRQ